MLTVPDTPCSGWEQPEGFCKTVCPDDDLVACAMWKAAVAFVYRATGHRFPGLCHVETQPCPPCACTHSCDRCGGPRQRIPIDDIGWCYPVTVINQIPRFEVVVDGVRQEGWRLTGDRQYFQRYDNGPWPSQDLDEQPGAVGTWTIRATIGAVPPPDLVHATARFACELVKEHKGQESCLPDGVRSITRRGLSMDVGGGLAETINFDTGGTGVPELDIVIREYQLRGFDVAAHFDPLDYGHHPYFGWKGWEFHHVWNPTPVGGLTAPPPITPPTPGSGSDDQLLFIDGNTLTIEDGNSVELPAMDAVDVFGNPIQT